MTPSKLRQLFEACKATLLNQRPLPRITVLNSSVDGTRRKLFINGKIIHID